MSQKSTLTKEVSLRYIYDGSLQGFYTCVFEAVYAHEFPQEIVPHTAAQPSMLPERMIATHPEKAKRVRESISLKICPQAKALVETVFLSCLIEKELHLLHFLLFGYANGAQTMQALTDPRVDVLLRAQQHLLHERHLLLGFIRFSDYDGLLAAQITPKNFLLPLLRTHFVGRYPNEDFVIVDKTFHHALLYQNRRCELFPIDEVSFPPPSAQEEGYRNLWKRFYHTIAIESRKNESLRRNLMPKRYWENMTEMAELL